MTKVILLDLPCGLILIKRPSGIQSALRPCQLQSYWISTNVEDKAQAEVSPDRRILMK